MGSSIDVDFIKIALRAKNIISRPRREWEEIAAEQTTVKKLYFEYFIPLLFVINAAAAALQIVTQKNHARVGDWVISVILYTLTGVMLVAISSGITALFTPKRDDGLETVQRYKLIIYASTPYYLSKAFMPVLSGLADRFLFDRHSAFRPYVEHIGTPSTSSF